jgi:signal transduction histidine kinase/CheY-like chemotaxis protein
MSLKQYTSLIRIGDILFFRALIAQTILLGVLGLSVLVGKIYLDKSSNEKIINNTFKKWESVITESVYIQQIVSEKEMPQVDNLRSFQNELKSYGVIADVKIKPCNTSADGIPLFIGKQKLNNCLFIQQDYQYIFKIGLIGFLLVFASIGVSLLVWRKAKKRMDKHFYNPLISAVTLEVNKFQKSESDRIKNDAVAKMATQVAHDIRSPLEVLRSLHDEMDSFPESTRMRISLSINRIEEISFNLLKKHKEDLGIQTETKSEELLGVLLSVVTEKSIEFRKLPDLELRDNFGPFCYGMFSKLERVSFKGIISNLINNATESLIAGRGVVKVELRSYSDKNVININDNGSGIPQDVAKNLFNKGFTTKKNGNGLGLYNAKQDIEAVGGTLTFTTEVGRGTTFTISLPKSETPSTFIDAIHAYKYERIIVLDDDPAFHEVWAKRLEGLESRVEHIYSVQEMFSKYQALHPKILLLSDFELMDKEMDGIDTILRLKHAPISVLVTARSEEAAIQERCLKNGIKLLPKSLVNYVMVRTTGMPTVTGSEGVGDGQFGDLSESSQAQLDPAARVGEDCGFGASMEFGVSSSAVESSNVPENLKFDFIAGDQGLRSEACKLHVAGEEIQSGYELKNQNPISPIVLIDDDRLIHLNWAMYCKKNGIPFQGFKSVEDFLKTSDSFDKSTRIYIDSNLGDGIKGELESEKIFLLGFQNLFLATGYQKRDIEKPAWIKEIYSKSPECVG